MAPSPCPLWLTAWKKLRFLCCISFNSIFFPGNSSALLVLYKTVFLSHLNGCYFSFSLFLFLFVLLEKTSCFFHIGLGCGDLAGGDPYPACAECVQLGAANIHPGFPNHNCCWWLRQHKAQGPRVHLLLIGAAFLLAHWRVREDGRRPWWKSAAFAPYCLQHWRRKVGLGAREEATVAENRQKLGGEGSQGLAQLPGWGLLLAKQ